MDNGVDLETFTRSEIKGDIFRRRYGLRREVIFSVGFVFPRKGIFDFIEMARRFPEHQFIWCGKKFKTWLTARPFSIGKQFRNLPSNVRFLGYVPDIEGAYNAGDIFLFPSYAENQGMAILEAAAVGKPVIVRALQVYQDWLVHGMNCLKADDNDEFVECIRILIEDKSLRNKCRKWETYGGGAFLGSGRKKAQKNIRGFIGSMI